MADVALGDRYLLKTMNMRRDALRVASAAPRPSRPRGDLPRVTGWAAFLAIGAIVAACGASPALTHQSTALGQSSIALAGRDSTTPSPQSGPAVSTYQDATSGPASLDLSADAGTAGSVAVPSSIDATGKTDASAALTAFFKSVPAGSTIQFKADGVYRMDVGLVVSRRDNLVLKGNGATLKSTGDWSPLSALITLRFATRITIRNLKLVGNDPTPGVYHAGQEWAHGIYVMGGGNIDVSGVTTSRIWGDCLDVSAGADTVSFHDSKCVSAGRHGVAIKAGTNVTIQRCSFRTVGYGVLDIEPNASDQTVTHVRFLSNSIGTFAMTFFAANGANGSTVSDVTVDGNTLSSGTLKSTVTLVRRSNIVFTNNVSSMEGAGPLLNFSHIDGLTVTGNVQPLTREPLLAITDCTNVVVQPPATTVLEMSVIKSPQAAGVATSVTVTAKDALGNVSTGYRGKIRIKSSDPRAVRPADYTFTAADAGVHVFRGGLTFRTPGTHWVSAYDMYVNTISGLQSGIVVNPGAAATFVVNTWDSYVAGKGYTVAVTAKDVCGNTAIGYRGRIHFTSSDPKAVRPADYTFTAADAGVHAFDRALTMKTAAIQSVTVTDTVTATINGTQTGIVVTAAAARTLVVSTTTSYFLGATHTVTVTAKDVYGNVATGYIGTIHFTSTDAKAVLPADYTFTATDAGVHKFTNGLTLKTAGTRYVAATDVGAASIYGTRSVTVTPGAARTFSVAVAASPCAAGSVHSVTVKALDAYGNVVTGYTGTIHLTSSDSQAVLPADYTFTAGDQGSHKFTSALTLKTAGARSVTAIDTAHSSIKGSQTVTVTPGAAKTLSVSVAANPYPVGSAHSLTVKALDAYGNVATGYTGTIHLASSDGSAVLPGDYTFTAADNGSVRFTAGITLNTVGSQWVRATDSEHSSITGSQTVTVA